MRSGGKPPSGTQRPQLMSQYSANHASLHASLSVAQFSQVAPGQSSRGPGSRSSQGSGTTPVPPVLEPMLPVLEPLVPTDCIPPVPVATPVVPTVPTPLPVVTVVPALLLATEVVVLPPVVPFPLEPEVTAGPEVMTLVPPTPIAAPSGRSAGGLASSLLQPPAEASAAMPATTLAESSVRRAERT